MLPSARIRYAANAGRNALATCTILTLESHDRSEARWNKQTDYQHRERFLISVLKRNGGKYRENLVGRTTMYDDGAPRFLGPGEDVRRPE